MPAGTPIRAYEWIAPPVALIAYAVIQTIVAMNATSVQAAAFSAFAASLAVAAAVALWISGYLAYRYLELRSTERGPGGSARGMGPLAGGGTQA